MKKAAALLLFTVLAGCSFNGTGEKRPENISEEVWNQGKQIAILTKHQIEDESATRPVKDEDLQRLMTSYKHRAEVELSSEEEDLINTIDNLWYFSLFYGAFGESEEDNEGYYDALAKVETVYGASALNYSNYDESDLALLKEDAENRLTEDVEDETKVVSTQLDKFKKKHNIQLDAKEVQFDMKNHFDQSFVLEGNGELSNYYNYRFNDEKTYFAVRMTPKEGKLSDAWHIYFDRKAAAGLYNDLLEGEKLIRVEAEIPSYYYKEGQGNMARAGAVEWYK